MELLLGLGDVHVGVFKAVHFDVYVDFREVPFKVGQQLRDQSLLSDWNHVDVLFAGGIRTLLTAWYY